MVNFLYIDLGNIKFLATAYVVNLTHMAIILHKFALYNLVTTLIIVIIDYVLLHKMSHLL